MRSALARRALAVLAVVAVVSCSGGSHKSTGSADGDPQPTPTTSSTDGQAVFLAATGPSVALLRWTVTGGYLTGTADGSTLDRNVTGAQQPISGTIKGNSVSFELRGNTWTGTLDGDTLTMHIPETDGSLATVVFTRSTIEDYNAAVAALHDTGSANAQATANAVTASNAARAVATADARLGSDLDDMTSALRDIASDAVLTEDIQGAATDLATARSDYKIVQRSVAAHDCGTAGSDAATVGSDAATVDSDLATIDSDRATIESDVTSVHRVLSALSDDYAALKQASLASPSTPAQHTQAQVDAAIDKADKAIRAARASGASARAKVAGYAKQAHDVADQAQRLADSCTE